MKTKFLLAAFIASVLSPIVAQTPDKAKLDSYFSALEANNKYMGSVALSKNGKTVYTKSIGYADVENNKKVSEESKFRIGSISKIFTATLVMKAVEANKLKLTDNLSTYFPTIPNASKITIMQLLQHRTGIHNFT
ncbi:MAG: class A beta-lactamase-related serine hydrolase, partial [Flavobacterium sp.]